jgi:threonyl-tRNA synthetase
MLIAGADDIAAGAVSFRFRDGSQINGVPVDEAVRTVGEWVERRENTSPSAEAIKVEN